MRLVLPAETPRSSAGSRRRAQSFCTTFKAERRRRPSQREPEVEFTGVSSLLRRRVLLRGRRPRRPAAARLTASRWTRGAPCRS
jgi:hypothetical protein